MTQELLKLKKNSLIMIMINILLLQNLIIQGFYCKINSNKTRHLLVENELKKLQTFDLIQLREKSHFEEDGTQNYLVFQPTCRYFKTDAGVGTGIYIYFWKSEGLSGENITALTTTDYTLSPQLSYLGNKKRVEFKGSFLKQGKIIYTHGKIVNLYIACEISKNYNISNYSSLKDCLFGAVSLTKNSGIDKHKYSGCGTGFDRHGFFLILVVKLAEM